MRHDESDINLAQLLPYEDIRKKGLGSTTLAVTRIRLSRDGYRRTLVRRYRALLDCRVFRFFTQLAKGMKG